MNANHKGVFQLLAIGIVVIFVVMMDRALFRVNYAEICQSVLQGAAVTAGGVDANGYRYGPAKYATQVVPSIGPAVVAWSGDKKQKRILITGGAGFIGSHLVDKLMDEGHVVTVLDNFFTGSRRNVDKWIGHPRFQIVEWDVILPIFMDVDQIYHLACPASPVHYQEDPVFTIKTNVMGTLNMLGLATRNNARFLLASTSEIYGDPLEHPQRETYRGNVNTTGIRSCYDEGKRVAETLSFDFHREKGTDIRVARIFNTFGDRMNKDDGRVVSNFIVQKLQGKPLTVYGGGKQTRSFCFVDDMVDGLYALMNTEGVTGPVNIGNPVENTILELAQAVAETIDGPGAKVNIDNSPMPSDDPGRRKPDITLAKQLLNWEPKVPLRDGLKKAVAYFRTIVNKLQ